MTTLSGRAALSALLISSATLAPPAPAAPLEPATQAFIDSLAGGQPIYTLVTGRSP